MPGENRRRASPQALTYVLDDLAVEIDRAMRRRGMRLNDLEKLGYCESQIKRISAWLRGADSQPHPGHVGAFTLAERLGVPIRILVGDEARAA